MILHILGFSSHSMLRIIIHYPKGKKTTYAQKFASAASHGGNACALCDHVRFISGSPTLQNKKILPMCHHKQGERMHDNYMTNDGVWILVLGDSFNL